jgi:small conductance mechanosensitive channel
MNPQPDDFLLATRTALSQLAALAVRYSFSFIGAIVLLVVGWILSGMISRWVYKGLSKVHGIDETLARFFQSVVHYGLLVLVFVAVLGQFGVQTTSLLAALGAAGLAIGLALQGTLQNIAAGIMLLVLRPLRVGEYIETGSVKGFIIEIGLFATEMKTADGLYLMAPNSTLWNTPITNHSREQERRQELSVAIGNDADASAVKQAILRIATGDKRVKSSPPPRVFSDGLTADKTVLTLQYWATTSQWSDTRYDMIDALKDGLKAQGVILK